MGLLNDLIEENTDKKDDESNLVNDAKDELDNASSSHNDTVAYSDLDGTYTEANMTIESFSALKNTVAQYLVKATQLTNLKNLGGISQIEAQIAKESFQFGSLENALPINAYSKTLTQVNYKTTLNLMIEEMAMDEGKMKTEIINTFDKFKETYDNVSLSKDDSVNSILEHIKIIDELISRKRVSTNPNKIFYVDEKEVNASDSPLSDILTPSELDEVNTILNKDLVSFIYQTVNGNIPNGAMVTSDADLDIYKSNLNIKTLEDFYEANSIEASLAMLNSYVARAADLISECKEITEKGEYQYLLTKLDDATDTITNLKFSNNVLTSLVKLDEWFVKEYSNLQALM